MNRKLVFMLSFLFLFLAFSGCDDGEDKKYGNLFIASEPAGAQISVGGESQTESTPAQLELEVGDYEITVSLYGYETPASQTVTITEDVLDSISFVLAEVTDFAVVNVSSMPEGAKILLDDTDTEFDTPATINVPAGTHTITLEKSGFSDKSSELTVIAGDTIDFDMGMLSPTRMVLLEEYTNVFCTPCANVARTVREVLEDYEDNVIFMEFHPHIAVVQQDIFYQMNPTEHNSRAAGFYSIGSLPHVYADGTRITTPDDPASVRGALNNALTVPTNLAIWGNWIYNGDGTGSANIFTLANDGISAQLYAIVAREHIEFDEAPGTNGLTEFHNVMYDCFPNPEGTAINLTQGIIDTMTFDFVLADSLVDEAKVFIFVQNLDKVVFQAAELSQE